MNEYGHVFSELRYGVWKVSFLESFLNGAIAFFAANIILLLFSKPALWALAPAGVVFLWNMVSKLRRYTLRRIEEGNPEVAEILRTAHDNKGQDTLLVHALFLELLQKMETVTAGVFLRPGPTILKLIIIVPLAFAPILITDYAPTVIVNNPLANIRFGDIISGDQPLVPVAPIAEEGERDILGERDVIGLGNEKLDITTAAGAGGVDFTKTEDATGNEFRYNDFPVTVVAEQTDAGSGGSAAESGLINDYSCKTKGTC